MASSVRVEAQETVVSLYAEKLLLITFKSSEREREICILIVTSCARSECLTDRWTFLSVSFLWLRMQVLEQCSSLVIIAASVNLCTSRVDLQWNINPPLAHYDQKSPGLTAHRRSLCVINVTLLMNDVPLSEHHNHICFIFPPCHCLPYERFKKHATSWFVCSQTQDKSE